MTGEQTCKRHKQAHATVCTCKIHPCNCMYMYTIANIPMQQIHVRITELNIPLQQICTTELNIPLQQICTAELLYPCNKRGHRSNKWVRYIHATNVQIRVDQGLIKDTQTNVQTLVHEGLNIYNIMHQMAGQQGLTVQSQKTPSHTYLHQSLCTYMYKLLHVHVYMYTLLP